MAEPTTQTPVPPVQGRCEHCKQTRAVFRYEPDHNAHLGAGFVTCRWCTRDEQPLLCTSCWSKERIREEEDSGLNEEAETWAQILAMNARAERRAARQREAKP